MNTAELTAAIIQAASDEGHRLFRNNSGRMKTIYKGRERWVSYGVGPTSGGGADLIGWCKGGRFASIEIKVGHDKQSEAQKTWERWVIAGGGVAGVARSVEDALLILSQ